jgi:hypothetical protein
MPHIGPQPGPRSRAHHGGPQPDRDPSHHDDVCCPSVFNPDGNVRPRGFDTDGGIGPHGFTPDGTGFSPISSVAPGGVTPDRNVFPTALSWFMATVAAQGAPLAASGEVSAQPIASVTSHIASAAPSLDNTVHVAHPTRTLCPSPTTSLHQILWQHHSTSATRRFAS